MRQLVVLMRRLAVLVIAASLLLATVVLIPAPLGAEDGPEKAATAAAETWLKLVDAGDYAGSWKEAAKLFKGAVAPEKWKEKVGPVREPLGKLVSRRVKSAKYETSLPGAPDGKYVVIQFESAFEHKKSAIETVTPMLDPDGKWRVSGYFIK